jgi:hypothetical protein
MSEVVPDEVAGIGARYEQQRDDAHARVNGRSRSD